jgi:tRNA A37 threonylcarbamoyladenosine synthetase subunit TsaC/SUA5/YrdC
VVISERTPTKGEQMITKRILGVAAMAAVLAIGGGPIAAASAKPAGKHAKHAKKHNRARAAQTDQTTTSTDTSGSTSVSDPGSTPVSGNSGHCPNM